MPLPQPSCTPGRARLRRLLPSCVVAAAAAVAALPASAQTVDRQARLWAATCAACHASGPTAAGGGIPSLAGQDAEQILRALLEFKNGQRPAATVMHQHAKGYSDEELRRIAQALAAAAR